MEGLDSTAEDLGRLGQVGDRTNLEAGIGQVGSGAVGGEELDARIGKAARKLENPFTVTDGEKRAQSTSSV